MPNGEKAMRLDEGRILYNDLAERIKNISFSDFATVEETRLIISEYEEEEDEGMVVETVFVVNPEDIYDIYFETVDSALSIAAAFKAGKNVVLHLPYEEGAGKPSSYGIYSDVYLQLCGYEDGYLNGGVSRTSNFYFLHPGTVLNAGNNGGASSINGGLIGVKVTDDKIRIQVYVD